eukprot:4556878-Pleurochrysis_carterae.AAC.2
MNGRVDNLVLDNDHLSDFSVGETDPCIDTMVRLSLLLSFSLARFLPHSPSLVRLLGAGERACYFRLSASRSSPRCSVLTLSIYLNGKFDPDDV